MKSNHPNENVEIVVLPGTDGEACRATDRRKIETLIKDKLLLTSKETYHKVQVEVERAPDGSPKALVAFLLRAYTFTADVVRVNVDANYKVKSIKPLSSGDAKA